MGTHYRISGQRCNLRRSPCACESPMAVSAAFAPLHLGCERSCCRSSVVEHPLGKGEVECSIHSGSTRKIKQLVDYKEESHFLGKHAGKHGAPDDVITKGHLAIAFRTRVWQQQPKQCPE